MDWAYTLLLVVVAVFLLRLLPGYLFGGTQDQLGYLVLWSQIEQHHNPYTDSNILVWPPLWWMLLGLWGLLWHWLDTWIPWLVQPLGVSLFLKCLYFLFELAVAWILARYLARAKATAASLRRAGSGRREHTAFFLFLPAASIITALHGNFDSIPAFFVMYAFLLLQFEPTETDALLAAAFVGLAAMARTFPILFAAPVVVHVFRRFRWTTGVFAAVLCGAPTFFSLYPVYLLTPDGVTRALGYRGISGGWWGIGGLARLFVSGGFHQPDRRSQLPHILPGNGFTASVAGLETVAGDD